MSQLVYLLRLKAQRQLPLDSTFPHAKVFQLRACANRKGHGPKATGTGYSIIREGLQAFRVRSRPVPAVPSSIIEPIWDQFSALLPAREVSHPLGCHRSRIPDRVVFDKLVQVLVFGCT